MGLLWLKKMRDRVWRHLNEPGVLELWREHNRVSYGSFITCRGCQQDCYYSKFSGYEAEKEVECCSPECIEKFKDKLIESNSWDEIAGHFYDENPYFISDDRFIKDENKVKLGIALVDLVLRMA